MIYSSVSDGLRTAEVHFGTPETRTTLWFKMRFRGDVAQLVRAADS